MSVLLFPNLNSLRLVLASGLVPPGVARALAAAGGDSYDRLWLEPRELPPRECLTALARVGVQVLGEAGVPLTPVTCWAALVPLQPAPEPPTGTMLFTIPERRLARFLARLRRQSRSPVGVSLHQTASLAWVTVCNPPSAILREVGESDSPIQAFVEQLPGVWVQCGWQHPVAELLVVPAGGVLLARGPRDVTAFPFSVPLPESEEFPLGRVKPAAFGPCRSRPIPIRLTFGPRHPAGRESLWVLSAKEEVEFWGYCASADASVLQRLEAARVSHEEHTRLVVRGIGGKRLRHSLPLPGSGYATDLRVPGLWVPASRELRPHVRLGELTRLLGLSRGSVVWIEPSTDGVVPHSVPTSAFRPVAELIEYHAPARVNLGLQQRIDPFPLARCAVEPTPTPATEPELPVPPPSVDPSAASPERTDESPGWLRRALQKLVGRLHRRTSPEPPRVTGPPQSERKRTGQRVERKLASTDALLHGQDWTARRRELESRLFHDLPRLGPEGRAARWADLASVYAVTGNPADAAVCWMNAAWEARDPPAGWIEQWLLAERRAAKLSDPSLPLERLLNEPWRPGVGRLIAAYSAWAGFATVPPPEFLAALPRILALLDQHFDDLPVRAAWLARLAAMRVCDGDALGLARWWDRVQTRLSGRGPGLDLDAPSFLRFHGTTSAERFQTARGWLTSVQKSALDWIQEHDGTGRFQREGLDAETECTAAYAQLMFAWGLGCLGERTRAREWATRARQTLTRAPRRSWVDPAVHAILGDLFLLRTKDAVEGRAPKPALPAELQGRIDRLPVGPIERYSIDVLREHSSILEPVARIRARPDELKTFWGSDRLGDQLFVMSGRPALSDLHQQSRELMALCASAASTENVPRIIFALLELAPWLEQSAVVQLLDQLPTAVDWVEAWLAVGRGGNAGSAADRLLSYQSRMIEAGVSAGGLLPAATGGQVVDQLVRRLLSVGDAIRAPLFKVAGAVFRTLRRLGLGELAETLVRFLDPVPGVGGAGLPLPTRLGLAAGWLTAGEEDTGKRILDDARDALYHRGKTDLRAHTELAIAYARALGFAPPKMAYGRLEEMFQLDGHGNSRLGCVAVRGGTNRYYTLQPLQLIDAVVRSVVTDEFTLGPAVRGWLDDDEFLIRGRVHRDLTSVLREQQIS